MDEFFLGIDVGGSNVKVGLVKSDGTLMSRQKFSTLEMRQGGKFVEKFLQLIDSLLKQYPQVRKVGIGLPGMLSRKRKSTITLANLPELDGIKLRQILEDAHSEVTFFLENDANAAALGEYHFSGQQMPDDFIFITLGTGVGGAAIINGKLFKGGRGNSMEVGHIMTGNRRLLEANIGKAGIAEMAAAMLKTHQGTSLLSGVPKLDSDAVEEAALKDDEVAKQVFSQVGVILGEGLVSVIRLLDVNMILIGGGVSKVFDHVRPGMEDVLHQFLPEYYTDTLDIRLAVLGNNAGIIGAASLCLEEEKA